jgi:hypothetical protein
MVRRAVRLATKPVLGVLATRPLDMGATLRRTATHLRSQAMEATLHHMATHLHSQVTEATLHQATAPPQGTERRATPRKGLFHRQPRDIPVPLPQTNKQHHLPTSSLHLGASSLLPQVLQAPGKSIRQVTATRTGSIRRQRLRSGKSLLACRCFFGCTRRNSCATQDC